MHSTAERVVWVRALTRDIVLCSWASHFTLKVPLSTQVYKWVAANLMLRVVLRWASIPSRGEYNTPSCFMLQMYGNRHIGPLGFWKDLFLFTWNNNLPQMDHLAQIHPARRHLPPFLHHLPECCHSVILYLLCACWCNISRSDVASFVTPCAQAEGKPVDSAAWLNLPAARWPGKHKLRCKGARCTCCRSFCSLG